MPNKDNEHSWQGPLRAAPQYFVGEFVGRIPSSPARIERYGNGVAVGTRDKAARRLIRKAIKAQASRVETAIRKARDLRREVHSMARNSHEKQRYLDQVLAAHKGWK